MSRPEFTRIRPRKIGNANFPDLESYLQPGLAVRFVSVALFAIARKLQPHNSYVYIPTERFVRQDFVKTKCIIIVLLYFPV